MSLNFGKMDFAVSFSPMTAFPLDARSYFESLAAAEAAAAQAVEAGSAEGTVYFGQTVTVVENGVAQMFQVQPDGTLGEIGGKIEIDEKQFVIDEETGKLNLYGFADAVAGAQLVVEEVDGVKALKWVKPDNSTVSGLQTTVASLQASLDALTETVGEHTTDIGELESRIDSLDAAETGRVAVVEAAIEALEEVVGNTESGLVKDLNDLEGRVDQVEGNITSINTALDLKANAADVYAKNEVYTIDETDNAIAVAVAGSAHLKYKIVEDVNEDGLIDINDIDVNAVDADQYIYLIPVAEAPDKYDEYMVINKVLERVGDWDIDLSDYAKASDVLALQNDIGALEESLGDYATTEAMNTALAEKANSADVENTLKNYAKTSDLTSLETTLGEEINKKVDAAEGYGLISDEDTQKLANIEAGAEVNYIKSVNGEQLKVEEGNLEIIGIDSTLIGGLKNATGVDAELQAILDEKAVKATVDSEILAIQNALDNKVDKNGTDRLITEEEGKKLAALVIGEGGSVEISGTVNASNVQELYNAVTNIVTGSGLGEYDDVEKQLLGIEAGAQVNKIESVTINGTALPIAGKVVDIPIGAEDILGVVKGSAAENKIAIASDGTMEVNSVNVNKLVQTDGDTLILNGGDAATGGNVGA